MSDPGAPAPYDDVLATLPVADLAQATAWCEFLFGRPADRTPMPSLAEWQVTSGGGVQVAEVENASAATVTLTTADLDALVAELRGRGVEVDDPTTGTGARFTQLIDPDGNTVVLATGLD
ncbi:MAG: VOC family protein [Nocardioides sp.]